MPMAMMPPARGLLNAASSVFFTVPLRVHITMNRSGVSSSRTDSSAAIFSSGCIDTRLAIALPLPAATTSGISWTLSQ